jgi:hypothetical protein
MNAAWAIDPVANSVNFEREYQRVCMTLSGTLFVPSQYTSYDCVVVDLSPNGARVCCSELPTMVSYVALYVEGFGRFNGFVARTDSAEIGLSFT